jgi:hypothetical protein
VTPREWYGGRLAEWTRRRDEASIRSVLISRLRLATFLAGIVLIWWGAASGHPLAIIVGGLSVATFAGLVAYHARLLAAVDRAEATRRVAERGIARIDRDWRTLDEISAPADLDPDAHPYARDLDVFGHASLTKWLGPTATPTGEALLCRWLLTPGTSEEISARQRAVEDLAGRATWRETFAAEGQLGRPGTRELARFMAWAEESTLAVPRSVRVAVTGLTVSIWLLIGLQAARIVQSAWWLTPMLIGIVLSFAFARRMYSVFDRVSIGERALEGYSTQLTLACTEGWVAPELTRQQAVMRTGGDAPRAVRRLSRLAGWSELRTGAALLHFPIQALTLWDFHVLFAIERWRDRHGRAVRHWLDALGAIDALAVVAAVRHDAPDWAFPQVDVTCSKLSTTSLGHPLIPEERCVRNDVEVGPAGTLLLITGSNMSGKSTLLRALGLNAVLAQTGAPVCAASFAMPPVDLQSSIKVQDSLELGLSYFMAALARLKAIVDAAERERPAGRTLVFLLDEVLQGTNSAERGVAVRAIARHLLEAGAIGAMTTHDLSLAQEEPFASHAQLVHFSEQVHADGRMTFDYRLRPGLATSRNALRLMQLIGISPQ